MKTIIGLVLGAICGVSALLYLPSRGLLTRDTQAIRGETLHAATVDRSMQPAPATPGSRGAARGQRARAEVAATAVADLASAGSTPSIAAPISIDPLGLPASTVSGLLIPVLGVRPDDLTDTFAQARGDGRVHDAIDIMAPRGTPVVAAHDAHIVKLFNSKPGGLTVYAFDSENRVVYYYAHLDGYARGLAEGQIVRRGDPIGFVGSTGNASADAPHLHFEVEILGPERQWWHATSINPYGRFEGQQPASAASAASP
ncbi:MAG: M23 family metallopeptidase [Rhodanobacter sp.]